MRQPRCEFIRAAAASGTGGSGRVSGLRLRPVALARASSAAVRMLRDLARAQSQRGQRPSLASSAPSGIRSGCSCWSMYWRRPIRRTFSISPGRGPNPIRLRTWTIAASSSSAGPAAKRKAAASSTATRSGQLALVHSRMPQPLRPPRVSFVNPMKAPRICFAIARTLAAHGAAAPVHSRRRGPPRAPASAVERSPTSNRIWTHAGLREAGRLLPGSRLRPGDEEGERRSGPLRSRTSSPTRSASA